MEATNKLNLSVNKLGSHFLEIDTSKKIINVEKSKIKDNSLRALNEVMLIIKDTSNYNKELDKQVKGTIYEKQNHTYFKVNQVLSAFDDLEKSTEKTIDAVLKVLLVSAKINFSVFVETLKDLEIYANNSHLLSDKDLLSNEAFLNKVSVISGFFNFITLYKDGKISKSYRKFLGGEIVTIDKKELNFIEVVRDYKINKKISLEVFDSLNNAYNVASKAFYASLDVE